MTDATCRESGKLDDLLEKTSRTFALSIPPLPEPTRREVTIAYLLFRIADTFEDAALWPPERRIAALNAFCALLERPSEAEASQLGSIWAAARPVAHAGYLELLASMPIVLRAFLSLSASARDEIRAHVTRSAQGMARFVERTGDDGQLRLETIEDLRDYCYVVAGIVGEMLTELFLLDQSSLGPRAAQLRERARRFGEALQLVNILKDSTDDRSEGRTYLPSRAERAEVFALARSDLGTAAEYVLILQQGGGARGLVEFCALPVQLAWASLEKIERHGPGSKVSRPELYRIVHELQRALDRGEPVVSTSGSHEGRTLLQRLNPFRN